jgi:hypothetical protein
VAGKPWPGRIFLNPPYAAGRIDKFVAKLLAEYQAGNLQQGELLTNSSTETRWWQSAAGPATLKRTWCPS